MSIPEGYRRWVPTHVSTKSGVKIRVIKREDGLVVYEGLYGATGCETVDRFDRYWRKVSE